MKALIYRSPRRLALETVADPQLQNPDDILLRVTATAICGSDLHIYRGKVPGMREGDILGHEFMGVVEETGAGVSHLRPGDRVVVPFVIACGACFYCDRALFAACEATNPGRAALHNGQRAAAGAGRFGYSRFYGGYAGGQAEYVRVPRADVGPLKIPEVLSDEQVLFLSDILPTGYQAALNAQVGPGSSLAIFGAGPVGLMAAACAHMLGAESIFMVDRHAYRLRFAQDAYGAVPINFDQAPDPVERLLEATRGHGVDASIDAVGFDEAKSGPLDTALARLRLEGSGGKTLRQCIAATRRGGTVSVPGGHMGWVHGSLLGNAFEKGLNFKMGPTHVQRFMPELLRCIADRRLKPEIIISHRLPLAQAVQGYALFESKQDGCRKVVLRP